MKFIGIIPARYNSTRFPGKPLAILDGRTVIQRVYEQSKKVLNNIYVATDDERIFSEVKRFGGNVIMTSPNHNSGTDRVEEAIRKIKGNYDVAINIQGDEPFIDPSQIEKLCESFNSPETDIATLGKKIKKIEELENPNTPKIILDKNNYAIYFSRSIVPFIRNKERSSWISSFSFIKHIGIYAYRINVLSKITQLPQSPLELAEKLEQLRWIENGYKIKVSLTDIETIGIDTKEDLKKAEDFLKLNISNSIYK